MCVVYHNLTEMNYKKQETLGNPKKRKLLKRRRVTFSSDINVVDFSENKSDSGSVSTSSCPQQQYVHYDSWYSVEDLEEFKNNIKEQAKKYRVLSNKAVSSAATESSLVLPFRNCGLYKKMKYTVKVQNKLYKDYNIKHKINDSKTPPEFRGLEHRIFFERQRNKNIATNTVLEFQRRCDVLIEEARANQRSETEIHAMKQQFAKRLSTIYSQLSQWAKDEAAAAAHYDASGVYSIPPPSNGSSNNEMDRLARNVVKRKAQIVSDDDSSSSSSTSENDRQFKRAKTSCASLN